MNEKTSVKSESSKTTSKKTETTPKQVTHKRESSSCGSCGVCSSLRSPRVTSENISIAMSQAKATGKESCAVSFMQKNHGNRFTASALAPSIQKTSIQKKCGCGNGCSKDKAEEEADKVAMSIMRKPSAISHQPSANNNEQGVISEIMSNKGSGHGLDDNTRSFMGERFGYNFGGVRIHADGYAARKSNELNAEAFTIGRDVFFNAGRYNPSSTAGKRLLGHELTHVVQQRNGKDSGATIDTVLQCAVSYDECTSGEETIVLDSHNRAINMVATAVRKLGSYTGTTPVNVRNALNTHFHSTGTTLSRWIAFNLNWLKGEADSPTYECEKPQVGRRLGWSMWCVPWTDIELYPLWFAESNIDKRARTIIHEWVHRYGCNFDFGYEWEAGYSGHGTLRSLLNADTWAYFVYDVR
ncbi:DUF4157 domain-containing protein [bacterium]|nr:DUF4157 domain-containing protein [bacterium]